MTCCNIEVDGEITQELVDEYGIPALKPIYNSDGDKKCWDCGRYFENVGSHWAGSDCHFPSIDGSTEEIITGLLLSDGSIQRNEGTKPTFCLRMINETFVNWLADEIPYYTVSVSHKSPYKSSVKGIREQYGYEPNVHDIHTLLTHSMPCLDEFAGWYENSDQRKRYPDDIELTPTILKMWYVGDGCLVRNGNSRYIAISCSNESDRVDVIEDMFSDIPVEPKMQMCESDRCHDNQSMTIRFSVEESQYLFKYMGEAPPGFGYKWISGPSVEEAKANHTTLSTTYNDGSPVTQNVGLTA